MGLLRNRSQRENPPRRRPFPIVYFDAATSGRITRTDRLPAVPIRAGELQSSSSANATQHHTRLVALCFEGKRDADLNPLG